MIFITESELGLLNFPGFLDRYYYWQGQGYTCVLAYEKVEDELESIFRMRRYNSYESFRAALHKHLKKVRQKKK